MISMSKNGFVLVVAQFPVRTLGELMRAAKAAGQPLPDYAGRLLVLQLGNGVAPEAALSSRRKLQVTFKV